MYLFRQFITITANNRQPLFLVQRKYNWQLFQENSLLNEIRLYSNMEAVLTCHVFVQSCHHRILLSLIKLNHSMN